MYLHEKILNKRNNLYFCKKKLTSKEIYDYESKILPYVPHSNFESLIVQLARLKGFESNLDKSSQNLPPPSRRVPSHRWPINPSKFEQKSDATFGSNTVSKIFVFRSYLDWQQNQILSLQWLQIKP